jgi:hypothetical protein
MSPEDLYLRDLSRRGAGYHKAQGNDREEFEEQPYTDAREERNCIHCWDLEA